MPIEMDMLMQVIVLTCVIAQSNPGRLLSFHTNGSTVHYHITMTSDNDPAQA